MGRAPCCDKSKVKRGPWSPEEDTTLRNYLHKHGIAGSWIALPQKAGLKRCGKSCRLRWLNYLRPNIKHGGFTHEEDTIILSLYHSIGSRWSVIAAQLPGRTDNDVKNHWNTKLKKKLYAAAGATNLRSAAAVAAAATSCSFISTKNSEMEAAAYSRNSELDYMLPYFPVDDVIDSKIPLVEEPQNDFTPLPSAPATLSPPFLAENANESRNRSCEDVLVEFGCGLMPYDLINAFDFHQKFNQDINHLGFGYFPTNAEQEQAIYQSFTY